MIKKKGAQVPQLMPKWLRFDEKFNDFKKRLKSTKESWIKKSESK